MQSEALVILLQETHCTDAEKLVLPNYQLAGSSLSRKHGLATFVHERLRYTLLDQSPPTSEIEWLCEDVDGYKIVNVYKPPPTRFNFINLSFKISTSPYQWWAVPRYFFRTVTGTVGTWYQIPVPRYFFYKVPRYSV